MNRSLLTQRCAYDHIAVLFVHTNNATKRGLWLARFAGDVLTLAEAAPLCLLLGTLLQHNIQSITVLECSVDLTVRCAVPHTCT
jgi:hypothetical protein